MKLKTIFYFFVSFSIFLIVWQLAVSLFSVNPFLYPSPLDVFYSFADSDRILQDISVSLWRLLLGSILAISLGILFGLLTGYFSVANETIGGVMNFFRFIPPLALVPLFLIWFGIGEFSKVSLLAWTAFFPVWISTYNGVKNIERKYLLVAKSLSVTRFFMLKEIIFKGSMPYILNGARIGISFAFSVLVAAEMMGAFLGMGHRIATLQAVYRVDLMMGYIIALGIIGLIIDQLFLWLSNYTIPWKNGE